MEYIAYLHKDKKVRFWRELSRFSRLHHCGKKIGGGAKLGRGSIAAAYSRNA